jgi:hypothetical protein
MGTYQKNGNKTQFQDIKYNLRTTTPLKQATYIILSEKEKLTPNTP